MFKLNVLTPERKAVFDQEIIEVTVPAYSGEMTILPGHAPLISTLGTGVLKYRLKSQPEKVHKALISWGYCEVAPGAVNVLAEFMQTPEEIAIDAAQKSLAVAEKKLAVETLNDLDFEYTMNEAAKARAAINLMKH